MTVQQVFTCHNVEWFVGDTCTFCEAKTEERERIIKLLEGEMEHAFGEDGKCVYEKHYREVCNCDLIALIKGENSDNSNVRSTADNTVNGTEGENK